MNCTYSSFSVCDCVAIKQMNGIDACSTIFTLNCNGGANADRCSATIKK